MTSLCVGFVVPRWDPVADPRQSACVLATAQAMVAAGDIRIELLTTGPAVSCTQLSQNITLRVLPWARPPRHPLDGLSWEIPPALETLSLLHIFAVFTRGGEAALLAARMQHKPVCVTECGWESSKLGQSIGILELAQHLSAASVAHAGTLRFFTQRPVTVLSEAGATGLGGQWVKIYTSLLAPVPVPVPVPVPGAETAA